MLNNDTVLTAEQVSMLENPPLGGPLHDVSMSQQKLINDGYLKLDPSRERYQLTEKGKASVNKSRIPKAE